MFCVCVWYEGVHLSSGFWPGVLVVWVRRTFMQCFCVCVHRISIQQMSLGFWLGINFRSSGNAKGSLEATKTRMERRLGSSRGSRKLGGHESTAGTTFRELWRPRRNDVLTARYPFSELGKFERELGSHESTNGTTFGQLARLEKAWRTRKHGRHDVSRALEAPQERCFARTLRTPQCKFIV